MASDDSTPPIEDTTPSVTDDAADRHSNTALNGIIGGVVAVVLSFVPLSPLLGGAVAGYLEGGDAEDRLKVGAIAGLVAFLPIVLVAVFLLSIFLFGTTMAAFALLLVFVLVSAALYTIGLGAIGGVLGAYVERERR